MILIKNVYSSTITRTIIIVVLESKGKIYCCVIVNLVLHNKISYPSILALATSNVKDF